MDYIVYIFQYGFAQLVLFGIYWLMLKQLTFFKLNRLFLLACLLLPIILPLIQFPSWTSTPKGIIEVWSQGVEIVLGEQFENGNKTYEWLSVLGPLYTLGVLLSCVLLGNKLVNIYRLIRNNPRTKLNNRHWIKVEGIGIASFFNYLFAPADFQEQKNYESILLHEEIHMDQKHSIDVLLAEIFQIIFWFNPLIYFIKKAILLNHEYLADDGVTKNSIDQKPYIKLLINNSINTQLQLSNAFFNSQLKNRIIMLQQKKSNPNLKVKYLSLLLAVFGMLFMFSCEQEVIPTKQDKASTTQSNKVNIPVYDGA